MTPDSPQALALIRLQASRIKLAQALYPAQRARERGWLGRPLVALGRWWRGTRPALAASRWLQAQPRDSQAIRGAGTLAFEATSDWVRRHPVAGESLAVALGALVFNRRSQVLAASALVVGGVLRQGQSWLVKQVSDPALYVVLATWLARSSPERDDAVRSE